jgi:transposase
MIEYKRADFMMGKQDNQLKMMIVDIGSFVPDNHLLKKIDKQIDFKFIYEKAKKFYSSIGRPSIDPVLLIKILMIGYLYGIKSERRLEEEINMNLAYRYFCRLNLDVKAPDHSTFSQNRRRRFTDNKIFREIFNEVIIKLIEKKLVTGENVVSDGTFIPGNVSDSSIYKITEEVEKSAVRYLDALDDELRKEPGYTELVTVMKEKTAWKSITDPDCGYIDHEHKQGMGYLSEMTVDTENGIVIGVDCYPANQRESSIILKHIEKVMTDTKIKIGKLGLDAGYDVGAVHRGLELLGVTGYVSCIDFSYDILKREAKYLPDLDCFECLAGKRINYIKLVYKKSTKNYYRLYRMPASERKKCRECEYFGKCQLAYSAAKICASPYYPAFYRNRQRYETFEYNEMKRLRGIWAEGSFAAQKREHNLSKAIKRGLHRISEECLFSALALNLKRMVNVINKRDIAYVNCNPIGVLDLFTIFSFVA